MNYDFADRLNPSNLAYAEAALRTHNGRTGEHHPPRPPKAQTVDRGAAVDGRASHPVGDSAVVVADSTEASLQHRIDRLVRAYRERGHLAAHLDPLGPAPTLPDELTPTAAGLDSARLREIMVDIGASRQRWTLGEWLAHLRRTYCGVVGAQYEHLSDRAARQWWRERLEHTEPGRGRAAPGPEAPDRQAVARDLIRAAFFEQFIQKRFIGAKTFSLEGGESLIALLTTLADEAGADGIDEIVMGMAHRGRLNVMTNTIGKDVALIFRELFDHDPAAQIGRGDVKYHLGACGMRATRSGADVRISLCFNPSHLEFVNPVAMGRVRAKQDRNPGEGAEKLCVLVHGDASIAGEGVVQETLNLAALSGYTVGGTIHVVINNQIGFTTTPREGRSTTYCTDVMLGFDVPVLHVNGDDPDAVVRAARLAFEYRHEFRRDVAIDLYCYRRRGHNEMDEPSFTQPLMAQRIAAHPPVAELYLKRHGDDLGWSGDDVQRFRRDLKEEYDRAYERGQVTTEGLEDDDGCAVALNYYGGREEDADAVETQVERGRLEGILEALCTVPEGFHVHRKIERGLAHRREMARRESPIDWAAAEVLALGSLSEDGAPIRLTGQDSVRGTFGQRHLTWHDVETGETYTPLEHLRSGQAPLELINSPLSEAAALGFEYGYSLARPEALVMWEAQYGDFANAAQVIIDQFITSAEDKWNRLSGLVLLLPHGFEGQGPEHSSARLERLLLLTAEHNVQVAQPTTPAQYFHLLRRQVRRKWRKPLFVLTPKSLLRRERAVSSLDDLAGGRFAPMIVDWPDGRSAGDCTRVLLCSGKIYYDLLEARERGESEGEGGSGAALVRIEQLYPFPERELKEALEAVGDETPVKWVQEEPENMGAWRFMRARFGRRLFDRYELGLVARCESASPASGSMHAHRIEQRELVRRALAAHDAE